MLNYHKGTGEYRNWILTEETFHSGHLGKCESIMALGNGYLGLRSAAEEPYVLETRGMFVSGTYNRFDSREVTELPNTADISEMRIYLNSELFSLEKGKILEYSRSLNLKDAELIRNIVWQSPGGESYRLEFKRFVSLEDLHAVAFKISIEPLSCNAAVRIKTGIDGRMTNSGSQHFSEGDKRVYDRKFLQLVQTTTESKIDFVANCCCVCTLPFTRKDFFLERRSIFGIYEFNAVKNTRVTFEKYASVFTSRDREYIGKYSLETLKENSLKHINTVCSESYDILFERSRLMWRKYWEDAGIKLVSRNGFDVLSLRFAQYHLRTMIPVHDERFNIGAKALTGEGYKGHVFWDTELFILPYFQYNFPGIARQLLKYRHLTLDGARNNAVKYGYKGAMYPWETAFTGGDETPGWAAINIVTGKPTRV